MNKRQELHDDDDDDEERSRKSKVNVYAVALPMIEYKLFRRAASVVLKLSRFDSSISVHVARRIVGRCLLMRDLLPQLLLLLMCS